jgi:endonuclease/exonuclease/phosphatase (EEP) superfamily protein YafD
MIERGLRRQTFIKLLNKIVTFLGLLYGVASIIYILGRLLIGEQWVLVELGNSLMPAILFPLFVFIPLCLFLRNWRLLIVFIPACILLVAQYAIFFVPAQPTDSETTISLRVLTFNLGSQIEDYDRVAALIRSISADILAVQELLSPSADALTTRLAELYPYRALHPVDAFASGVGVFSQYPILEDTYLDMLSLGGQQSRIQINDENEIVLLNVHPTSPRILGGFDSSRRHSEIEGILDLVALQEHPLLMTGDFNITDQTEDYGLIAAQLGDAFRASGTGFGLTFPNLARFARPLGLLPPFIRIDYVFFSDDWQPMTACVLPDNGGSDHYPLYAEVGLLDTS